MVFFSMIVVANARIQLLRTIVTGLVLPAIACALRTVVLELCLPFMETEALKTGQSHSEIDAMLSQTAISLELVLNVTPTVILFKSLDGIGAALVGAVLSLYFLSSALCYLLSPINLANTS